MWGRRKYRRVDDVYVISGLRRIQTFTRREVDARRKGRKDTMKTERKEEKM